MAPQGENKLAKIGQVFSQVNNYYTVRCQAQGLGKSTVGTAKSPTVTETVQHYQSYQPAGEKKGKQEMSSEEAAEKLGGLAAVDHGVVRSSSRLGFSYEARHEKHRS